MKIAVVGMGHFGPRRLDALAQSSGALDLVACDHHPHKLEPIVRSYPRVRTETSFERVISDPSIDAVVLSTPIPTHFELGLAALEAGKHLFVEKPLAPSVRAAERLALAAERKGRVLHVGHSFEQSPVALAMSALIREGELGTLLHASMRRVNLGRHQRGTSVLWDLAIHDVSLLLRWLDEDPSSIRLSGRAVLAPGQLEVAHLTLEFPSGFVAQLEASWLAPERSRLIHLVGTKAALEHRATESEAQLTLFDCHARSVDREVHYHRGGRRLIPLAPDAAIHRELEAFITALEERPLSGAETTHALRVIRVLEAAERSWAGSRPPGES